MSGNPFPGPQPYRAADRARFFGRDALSGRLADQILARPATTVFGPSGAGKSSLMQAGVIPMLVDSEDLRVVRVDAWPADQAPLPWLLEGMSGGLDLGSRPPVESQLDALEETIERAKRRSDRPILVYLDQLEQLFVWERSEEDMKALLQGLDWLIQPRRQELHLVLSLREDYLGRLRDWARERGELLAHSFRVGPLSVGEMVNAMCRTAREGEPAQRWRRDEIRGLMLEVRVAGQRQADTAEVEAAFGQIVCRALWSERSAGKPGGARAVDAEAILQRYLDATVKGLGALQGAARELLEKHLVDDEGNRRLLTEREARRVLPGKEADEVLERLQRAAVLHAEGHQGSRYFELGHDWLARKVVKRRRAREKEEAEKKRAAKELAGRKRLGVIASLAVMVTALMGVLLIWALRQRNAARAAQEQSSRSAETADLLRDAAQTASQIAGARELLARDQGGPASRVFLEVRDPESAPGWRELADDLLGSTFPRSTLSHQGEVNSAAWSPDGLRLVTASGDRTARVWNADGAGNPVLLPGHGDAVNSAAWSPDGQRIVTASDDGTARLWNVQDPRDPILLVRRRDKMRSGAWSPDGARVVAACDDGTAWLCNADGTGSPIALRGHREKIDSVAWSPDGKHVVTASEDGTARVWDADDPGRHVVLKGHRDGVRSAAWSPDGKRIVTASADHTARIWDADDPGRHVVLKGHQYGVHSAAWSPDGERIVTASNDGTARVWNADGSGDPIVLKGHGDSVLSAAWSPDGRRIVTASVDHTARVWNADGTGDSTVLKGHAGVLLAAVWRPDGQRLVTASRDQTARVWKVSGVGAPVELDIRAIQRTIRDATTDCLSPELRQKYLLESARDARTGYANCEESYERTPFFQSAYFLRRDE
jgi:WD40 repeat protein